MEKKKNSTDLKNEEFELHKSMIRSSLVTVKVTNKLFIMKNTNNKMKPSKNQTNIASIFRLV